MTGIVLTVVHLQTTGYHSGWEATATPAVSGGGSGPRPGSPAGPSGGAGPSSTPGVWRPTTRTVSPSGAGGRWGLSRSGRTKSARKTIIMFANISGEWRDGLPIQDSCHTVVCRIQEYMEEEMNSKITQKLEENLEVVENIRRARELDQ